MKLITECVWTLNLYACTWSVNVLKPAICQFPGIISYCGVRTRYILEGDLYKGAVKIVGSFNRSKSDQELCVWGNYSCDWFDKIFGSQGPVPSIRPRKEKSGEGEAFNSKRWWNGVGPKMFCKGSISITGWKPLKVISADLSVALLPQTTNWLCKKASVRHWKLKPKSE